MRKEEESTGTERRGGRRPDKKVEDNGIPEGSSGATGGRNPKEGTPEDTEERGGKGTENPGGGSGARAGARGRGGRETEGAEDIERRVERSTEEPDEKSREASAER